MAGCSIVAHARQQMKAMVLTAYGDADVLRPLELPRPEPKPGEVLVRVAASAVNDWDWSMMRGRPLVYRLFLGLRTPRTRILGAEVAGRVESVGAAVQQLQPGDAVYGDISESGFGAFAEYVCVREDTLSLVPKGLSLQQAATVSHAANLAVQGLIDRGKLQAGERVLINGAGGGVGTFGVQLAKALGAGEVTGVDSADKLEMMRSVGFDHVLDYHQRDFTATHERYDLILDTKTSRSPFRHARALTPSGRYVTVGGHLRRLLQMMFLAPLYALLTRKRLTLVALRTNKDLDYVNQLLAAGTLKCVVDGPYPLVDLPKAMAHFGAGKHQGKVVIAVGE